MITVRKRSLVQGNVFTPVCHSVHRGEVCIPECNGAGKCLPLGPGGVQPPWVRLPPGHTPLGQTPPTTPLGRPPPSVEMTIEAGGTHPTAMHSYLSSNWNLI